MGLCASDWFGFNCGDCVREHNGRHFGRVDHVTNRGTVKVKWDSGIVGYYDLDDLIKSKTAGCELTPDGRHFYEY